MVPTIATRLPVSRYCGPTGWNGKAGEFVATCDLGRTDVRNAPASEIELRDGSRLVGGRRARHSSSSQ